MADPILDAAGLFSRSLIPTIGGGGPIRRVPFTFTSTRRLLNAGVLGAANSRELAKMNKEEALKTQLSAIGQDTQAIDIAGTVGLSAATSTLANSAIISMMVNPNTVRWSQPKRFTKRDTQNGSTFFHFSDDTGRNNDILTLNFSGNTGNINTQHGPLASSAVGADLKLKVWHELYSLTREPILIDNRLHNDFIITYRTVLFPMPITFYGFFSSVLEFTESAANPNSRDYSFSFTVTHTSPGLDTLTDKLSRALAVIGPVDAARSIL